MLNIRKITRTALLASVIAAGSFATGTAHADPLPQLQISSNIHCSSLTNVMTLFNNTASPMLAGVRFQSSLQDSIQTTTVPANSWVNLTFHLTIGERIDKIILFRDNPSNVEWTIFSDRVVTGTGDCTRAAFHLVEVDGYSLACANGLTYAAITFENKGDYPEAVSATANPIFATEDEYNEAVAQGLASSDTSSFTLSPHSTQTAELFFKIVDQFAVRAERGQTTLLADGPRSMATGEGCNGATTTTEAETTDPTVPTEDTTPDDTTPDDTTPDDTTGDTTDEDTTTTDTATEQESGAAGSPEGTPTTDATVTTLVGAAGGSLPVTGRGSLGIGTFGAIMFFVGLGLVRSVRRRSI